MGFLHGFLFLFRFIDYSWLVFYLLNILIKFILGTSQTLNYLKILSINTVKRQYNTQN
jgi:hypothetical protein